MTTGDKRGDFDIFVDDDGVAYHVRTGADTQPHRRSSPALLAHSLAIAVRLHGGDAGRFLHGRDRRGRAVPDAQAQRG